MALWKKVQTLDEASQNSIFQFYEENLFPIEIRNIFANFIEEEILGRKLEEANPYHIDSIRNFINTLVLKIESFVNSADGSFYVREKLNNTLAHFKSHYRGTELRLFREIKAGLKMENETLAAKPYEGDDILQSCRTLKERMSGIHNILQLLDNKRKEVDVGLRHRNMQPNMSYYPLHGDSKRMFEETLNHDISDVMDLVRQAEESLRNDILQISDLAQRVIYNLSLWNYQKQTSCRDSTLQLDELQLCCEELVEIIWMIYLYINNAEVLKNSISYLSKSDIMSSLKAQIFDILKSVLKASFVIEEQPCQILKQNAKFPNSMKVRHLSAHKLNAHKNPQPEIRAFLIDEEVVQRLDPDGNYLIKTTRAEISSSSQKISLEYDPKKNTFSATFKNCLLKNFKRLEKKEVGKELVTEDKFCVYFETEFIIGDVPFKVWTISHPVVIITHGSQEAQAVATIFWDNAFCKVDRVPFNVPVEVPWVSFIESFNRKFKLHTGREISPVQENYLKAKLFGGSVSQTVSRRNVCKENMPDTSFTFWHWCYEIMKLIEMFLKQPWCDGHITGIIDRKSAENTLAACKPGTFLVRFSDSILGAVTITWKHLDGRIYSINPLTKTELSQKSLGDWIMSVNHLQFLYPQIPKANAFKRLCKPTPIVKGYVPLIFEYRPVLQIEEDEPPTDGSPHNISQDLPERMDTNTKSFPDTMDLPSCQYTHQTSELMNFSLAEEVRNVINNLETTNSNPFGHYQYTLGDHYMNMAPLPSLTPL